jgi:hypothetical protein
MGEAAVRRFGILLTIGLAIASAGAAQQRQPGAPAEPLQAPSRIAGTQSSDYFPLATGNLWIYQGGGVYSGTFLTLQIAGSQVFQGSTYFLLHGFAQQDYWLREDARGSVFQYDSTQAAENLWWAFGSALGLQYSTALPGVCCGVAKVSSRSAAYKGPLGTFGSSLQISYPGVFQVGIVQETFLPGVGLALRTQATGGPSYGSWELIYARVGGVTVDSAPELSFSLALDNAIYTVSSPTAAPVMTARLRLRNTAQPITLNLLTSQRYDLTITDANGTVVYQWSYGKAFSDIAMNQTFGPGEEDFLIQVPLTGSDKAPLPAGQYVAEGWLTTGRTKLFDASVPFQVAWVH